MIDRLELTAWKAFDDLTLGLERGTTFIVARNGVGKTSIMQGAAFALFGEQGLGFPPEHAVRRTSRDVARVAVTLTLPSGAELSIARTAPAELGRGRRPTFEANVGTRELSESDLRSLVGDELRVDPATLHRLAFVPEGAVTREAEEPFNPVGHINRMFSADRLSLGAERLGELERRFTRSGDSYRAAERRLTDERIAELERDLADRQHDCDVLAAEREAVPGRLAAQRALVESANAWSAYRARRSAESDRLRSVTERVVRELGVTVEVGSLVDSLGVQLGVAEGSLEDARARGAEARARLKLVDEGFERLREAGTKCPVCRRPLESHDRDTAEAEYAVEAGRLRELIESVDDELNERREAMDRLLALVAEATPNVISPPGSPEPEHDLALLEAQAEAVAEDLRRLDEAVGVAGAERDRARQSLSASRESSELWDQALGAYRRADLAAIAATTMTALADRIFKERAEPLGKELAAKYEQLLGKDGLVMDGGSLALRSSESSVDFKHWSGGERAFAVVLLRILTLRMTTQARFLWLDEPLEHVDPRNRRVLAGMLSEVTARGEMDQILVTTYEERVTRRLADRYSGGDRPARLVYVDRERQEESDLPDTNE